MALNTVTLTWDLADFLQAGIADQCVLSVTPTFLVADNVDDLIIPAVTRSVTFSSGTGVMSGIVANDNGSLVPTGSTYTISVLNRSTGQNIVGPFTAAINTANGSTQDLSFLYENQSFTYPSFFQYTTQNSFGGSIAGSQFNIISYGADPSGVKDSSASVAAAYNAAKAAGGGYVFYPPGTFKQGTIRIPGVSTGRLYVSGNVHFMFSGVGVTVLVPNAANLPLFNVDSSSFPCAAGVRFTGGFTIQAHASGSTGAAIDLTGARQWVIESPSYWDSSKGTSGSPGTYAQVIGLGNNSYANHIVNPICEAQHIGSSFIGVPAVTGIASNNNSITNILVESCTVPYVIDGAGSGELNIKGGIIEGNTSTAAIRLGVQTHVREVHFESNTAFAMDNHGVDSTDAGSCWLESNVYNAGSGTFTIPVSTLGRSTIAGPLGALTVVDNTASYLNISGSVLGGTGPTIGGLITTPFTGDATTGTISAWDSTKCYHRVVLTGNVTVGNASGTQTNGQVVTWEFVQANSGGPYTVTFGGQFLVPVAFTQSVTANTSSTATFVYNSTLTRWVMTANNGVTLPNVQFFSAGGTWTMPAGAQTVYVSAVAGGGGGGSGAFAAAGAAGGGGGGGSGGYSAAMFQASQITSPVSVTVGSAGSVGAAVTGAGAGNPGGAGGTSSFGTYLWAHGGSGGAAGNATNAGPAAGGAGGFGLTQGGVGGASVTTGSAGGAGTGLASGGGGAGGGVIAGPTAEAGGGGTAPFLGGVSNSSAGGVVGGASPTNGSAVIQGDTAPGGGGGAAATSGAAQPGASATVNTGAGGGGGGACTAGTTSGTGGLGGTGFVLVIAYFQ